MQHLGEGAPGAYAGQHNGAGSGCTSELALPPDDV